MIYLYALSSKQICRMFVQHILSGILNFVKMVSIRKISPASLDSYTREQMRHQIDSQGQATGGDDAT
jgi:hypothetical protein